VLSGSADRTLKLWDAESGAELRAFAGHQGSVLSCAFSPDGRRVLSGSADKTLKLWDAESGQLLRDWQLPWAPQCVVWNPKQPSLVVVAWPNGTCALFNIDAP
jgi:WD40 repeat protein